MTRGWVKHLTGCRAWDSSLYHANIVVRPDEVLGETRVLAGPKQPLYHRGRYHLAMLNLLVHIMAITRRTYAASDETYKNDEMRWFSVVTEWTEIVLKKEGTNVVLIMLTRQGSYLGPSTECSPMEIAVA